MDKRQYFRERTFDVEHALNMYATSFVLMPAPSLYDETLLRKYAKNLETCHIYLIGFVPRIERSEPRIENGDLVTTYMILGATYELHWPIPPRSKIETVADRWWVSTENGDRIGPTEQAVQRRLNDELDAVRFEVLYIGQSYGKDGSRNAVDRLLKHETLQKISLQGIPTSHQLYVVLLEIQPANRMITVMNPFAKHVDEGNQRISAGLDKLFDTNEAERITLYEASLIRYFQPRYNKEFKDSFPSTNMKVLADCFKKDFAALIAEICIDEIPFKMFTTTVPAAQYHSATHDLHDDVARKVFFT
jgi:hypothetical protein